ncbi:MAG: UDP-2,3-diacylglucosamine diphosphatase [Bacteroidia bacterium]|nr:UDP-2,3-diacylglucosamine diphosphatase [Bacteroidia bacterium]
MLSKGKIYFLSDFHLGIPNEKASKEREMKIVEWLDSILPDVEELFILGDVFDFWFEYKTVVPRGYVRILGKLAEIADAGIPIHYFTGNHDMWTFDYLTKEIGVKLYREPITREIGGKKFYIGHGDGLGPGDQGYKFIKKVFANKICQWLFARLHPNFGIGLANYWSRRSRGATGIEEKYLGDDKEWLYIYCKDMLKKEHFDYFVFGHRHLPINKNLGQGSTYINLGDWISFYTYAVFDGEKLELNSLKENTEIVTV